MSTLFISDLHLDDKRPQTTEWFFKFLRSTASGADALYILGDLFEYWIGDDALSPVANEVAEEISRLDIPVAFMHGNRDFLLGEDYCRKAGMTLLQEPTIIDLYGIETALLHGDHLCTDDVAYQAVRQQVRNPIWQQAVLEKSIEERLAMASDAREKSKQHTLAAELDIMDVNDQAVRDAFHQYGVQQMIHGHTHRPAIHHYEIDGEEATRVVLGDWYKQSSVLSVTEGTLALTTPDSSL